MKKNEIILNAVVMANKIFADKSVCQQGKRALSTLIENMLMDAKVYGGFGNIYWMEKGYQEWVRDGKPENNYSYMGYEYDRHYYTNKIKI